MKIETYQRHVASIGEFFRKNNFNVSEVLATCAEMAASAVNELPAKDREKVRNWFFDRFQDAIKLEDKANA